MILSAPIVGKIASLHSLDASTDKGIYLNWLHDPAVNRFLEARFRQHTVQSLDAYIERCNGSDDTLFLGIYFSESMQHIGNVKLGPIAHEHRRAEIGIMIGDKTAWGKGVATETIELLCTYAFEELSLHKVTAGIYENNTASLSAFLKAGFTQAARLPEQWYCDGNWIAGILTHRFNEQR